MKLQKTGILATLEERWSAPALWRFDCGSACNPRVDLKKKAIIFATLEERWRATALQDATASAMARAVAKRPAPPTERRAPARRVDGLDGVIQRLKGRLSCLASFPKMSLLTELEDPLWFGKVIIALST
ncbi:MAG TPA: hypothetical protein VF988_12520 [Verrucomicrobiae bacterium]